MALEIGEFDDVAVDDSDVADAGAAQLVKSGAAESACSNDQCMRSHDATLARFSDCWENELAGVACEGWIGTGHGGLYEVLRCLVGVECGVSQISVISTISGGTMKRIGTSDMPTPRVMSTRHAGPCTNPTAYFSP